MTDDTPRGGALRLPATFFARPRKGRSIGVLTRHAAGLLGALMVLVTAAGYAQAQSNIAATKHNLSASGSGAVKALDPASGGTSQICVFCHTPHAANASAPPPLWNRTLSGATYTPYTSNSLDAAYIANAFTGIPEGSSKLCLSCHDGTMALGTVGVLGGNRNVTISMTGTSGGKMPAGAGATSGFTRNLGVDLRNDHPISVTFSSTLAARDGELRTVDAQQRYPADGSVIGIRSGTLRPLLPLQPTGTAGAGQVQCTTCHDPHLTAEKFLRLNRYQVVAPSGGDFNPANDQICLGCHDKLGTAWSQSAHANPVVANEAYTADAAARREFKENIQVWEAACLNCHDTHAVQGTRRLLREGISGAVTGTNSGAFRVGSGAEPNTVSAIEETCYQCHQNTATRIINDPNGEVPDIRTDFTTGTRRMPITSTEQKSGVETHDIGGNFNDSTFIDCTTPTNTCGADFVESRSRLGVGNLNNRHAECTDCHNPHRVLRNSLFNGSGDPNQRTHTPGGSNGNIASGALRGTFGVEPTYSSASFFQLPSGYEIKRGDGGTGASTAVISPWVTREYQVCLKCHSDYGYTDDNVLPSGSSRPQLGAPGTPSPRTNFTRYTNQAREFQAPLAHQGAATNLGTNGGAGSNFNASNHRSWHPVMAATGRGTAQRNSANANSWRAPWNANVGTQTMHCSDCHGNDTAPGTIVPSTDRPWGPHGSTNDFILKGLWNTDTDGSQANALCFKCHEQQTYAPTSGGGGTSGFLTDKGDGHFIHSARSKLSRTRCNWCHVAVPHGWKNKALLVNLNDVGPEVGLPANTERANGSYTNGPYYRNAILKIVNFKSNSQWLINDCGSLSDSGDRGIEWMKTSTCSNPP